MTVDDFLNEFISMIEGTSFLSDMEIYEDSFTVIDDVIHVDNYVALPVSKVSSKYSPGNFFKIVMEDGCDIGSLFCSEGETFSIFECTPEVLACFFTDFINKRGLEESFGMRCLDGYIFSCSYVVLRSSCLENYSRDYKDYSSLWGGFSHLNFNNEDGFLNHNTSEIMAFRIGRSLGSVQKDLLNRSILTNGAFDRYLRLYHLLEVDYDYLFVKKMQGLSDFDSRGLSSIMMSFKERTEMDRLKFMFLEGFDQTLDFDFAEKKFNLIFSKSENFGFLNEMLFFYSKDGNPFPIGSGDDKIHNFIVDHLSRLEVFTFNEVMIDFKQKTYSSLSQKEQKNVWDKLIKFLVYFVYFVYRVRCGLAHTKIGEHLFLSENEIFVVNIAEEVLRKIICKLFRN